MFAVDNEYQIEMRFFVCCCFPISRVNKLFCSLCVCVSIVCLYVYVVHMNACTVRTIADREREANNITRITLKFAGEFILLVYRRYVRQTDRRIVVERRRMSYIIYRETELSSQMLPTHTYRNEHYYFYGT